MQSEPPFRLWVDPPCLTAGAPCMVEVVLPDMCREVDEEVISHDSSQGGAGGRASSSNAEQSSTAHNAAHSTAHSNSSGAGVQQGVLNGQASSSEQALRVVMLHLNRVVVDEYVVPGSDSHIFQQQQQQQQQQEGAGGGVAPLEQQGQVVAGRSEGVLRIRCAVHFLL